MGFYSAAADRPLPGAPPWLEPWPRSPAHVRAPHRFSTHRSLFNLGGSWVWCCYSCYDVVDLSSGAASPDTLLGPTKSKVIMSLHSARFRCSHVLPNIFQVQNRISASLRAFGNCAASKRDRVTKSISPGLAQGTNAEKYSQVRALEQPRSG